MHCTILITEIFRGNLENVEKCPPDLVQTFSELLATDAHTPFALGFVEFFACVVNVLKEPVVKNQTTVLRILFNMTHEYDKQKGKDQAGVSSLQRVIPESLRLNSTISEDSVARSYRNKMIALLSTRCIIVH